MYEEVFGFSSLRHVLLDPSGETRNGQASHEGYGFRLHYDSNEGQSGKQDAVMQAMAPSQHPYMEGESVWE